MTPLYELPPSNVSDTSLYVLAPLDEPPTSYAPESLYALTLLDELPISNAPESLYALTLLDEPPQNNNQAWMSYALILLMVIVVTLAILTVLGPQIGNVFSNVTCTLGT